MARAVRVSSTWSDIRIVLDDEAARLKEADTGLMRSVLRSLSGRQKLTISSRMEARDRQQLVTVHIAHATVHVDAFVAFLRATLGSVEYPFYPVTAALSEGCEVPALQLQLEAPTVRECGTNVIAGDQAAIAE